MLEGVRRLRTAQARRGRAGRKRRRGRPGKKQRARRKRRGPTAREKAAFVWKHRFLIVKRSSKLTEAEQEDLRTMFAYLPALRPLASFSQDVYRALDDSKTLRVARWRFTWLRYDPRYKEVQALMQALDVLAEPKLTKAMAFVGQRKAQQVRTNNHVERMNRRLRFAEKVRYRWRKRKWVVRWMVLLLDVCWEEAGTERESKRSGKRAPPQRATERKKQAA